MKTIFMDADGNYIYYGDTFQIVLQRYSDPQRLNAARNAAIYLGKEDRNNTRRPLSIIKAGHVPEIFRGEYAEFEFIDVSKEVYDHLVTYTTRNMRVAGGNRALRSEGYTMPSDKMKNPDMIDAMINRSMSGYYKLLDEGETRQVARSAMPVNAKMNNFVFQFNFLTLMTALFKQRIWEKGAQGNTVKVVRGMFELVRHVDAELWDTANEWYGEPAAEWAEVRRMMKKRRIKAIDVANMIREDFMLGNIAEDTSLEELLRRVYGQQQTMWD